MTYMSKPLTMLRPEIHSFWATALPHLLAPVSLPEDKTRPQALSTQSCVIHHQISPAVSQAVSRMCTQEGLDTPALYAATIGFVIRRLAGKNAVTLGVPCSASTSRLTHLPLHLSFEETAPTIDTLRSVQTQMQQATRHADIPFDQLIETIRHVPTPTRHPIFQIALEFDTHTTAQPMLCKADKPEYAPLDLCIRIERNQIKIAYAVDLHHPQTIVLLGQRIEAVLYQICTSPRSAASGLTVISDAEQTQLAALYDEPLSPSAFTSIPQMISDTTRRQPFAPAVRDHDHQLSYQRLDTLSDRAAAQLADQGVTHGSNVGVHLTRSPEIVAWLLGILKLGAIYVPIDTSYPDERVQALLADAPCGFCLLDTTASAELPQTCTPIHVDNTTLRAAPDCPAPILQSPTAEDTAYLIYTSGSTGQPKGIRISHGNVINLLEWTRATFSKQDLNCVAATTSLNFDMSIFEIFGTLAAGGTLLMLEDALDIIDSPLQHEISLIDTVPSAMAALLPLAPDLTACGVVNLGGEALPRALCDQIQTALPQVRLFNMYGPSETTTFSTFALIPRDSDAVPNIGKPLRNTQLLVLNDDGTLTPKGRVGELFIGGSGVTQGYLNRDALTAEKYVTCAAHGTRGTFFRTGDLVSWGHDGELRYHGRRDHQVKIRGHRVELGEIDAVLGAASDVDKAFTIGTQTPGQTEMMLVAYVTGDADPAALKSHLATRLPSYMVPRHIVVLGTLPLNANGKLDRAALPDPMARIAQKQICAKSPAPAPSDVVAAHAIAAAQPQALASAEG